MIGGYFGGGGEIKKILKNEDVIAKIAAIWHNLIGFFCDFSMNFTEKLGVQASQLIQARCSEITSADQTHRSQKDSAERDADDSWPNTIL